jgi:hypothetical protein
MGDDESGYLSCEYAQEIESGNNITTLNPAAAGNL